jgi:hypothetical protein
MHERFARLARWWLVVTLLFCGGAWAAGDCQVTKWVELSPGLHFCVAGTPSAEVAVVAVDLSRTALKLTGAGADGKLPTSIDVDQLAGAPAASDFTLQQAASRSVDDLLISVGYPESAKSFVPDGLVRIAGEDLSDRDTSAEFKSAMFCLSELAGVRDGGSVPIVFNAFEDGAPIELNPRVLDRQSCRDVIQVGPRIIEYRGKEGISRQATRRAPQRYVAFALGGGPRYMGYFMTSIDDVTLYTVQDMLLAMKRWSFDDEAVVAVTLAAGSYAGMAVRDPSDRLAHMAPKHGDYHVVGAADVPIGAIMLADVVPPDRE